MGELEKFKYYRDALIWPIRSELDFEGWISNFENEEERKLAKRILDFFVYLPDVMVDKMLQAVVGYCGYYFKTKDLSWTHDSFKVNCFYSYIPGEQPNPTDSGYLFMRKLRDKLRVPENRIVDFGKLLYFLDNERMPQNVILVDDFVGSGAQCDNAWNKLRLPNGKNLSQITQEKGHRIVYAPLIINTIGFHRIQSSCSGLELKYIHCLTEEYNLFSPNCPCWDNDMDTYNKGMQLIEEKSTKLNIPMSSPNSVIYYQGFGSQGLAIAFSHGMPDACIPLFYWACDDWTPLINKNFHRN